MDVRLAALAGVFHVEAGVAGDEHAPVAHLAAGLGVERRALEQHHAGVPGFQAVHGGAVAVEAFHLGLILMFLVTGEVGDRLNVEPVAVIVGEGAGAPGALTLRLHFLVEAVHVHGQAALTGDVGGQVGREAMSVVESEHHPAGQLVALQVGHGAFQHFHAGGQGAAELLFLGQQGLLHPRLLTAQLGVGVAHLRHQLRHQGVEERLVLAQLVTVTQGAADDTAQHIAAPLVGRHHPVGDQETGRADMVGDHPQGFVFQVVAAGGPGGGLEQRLEQVDLIVGMHALLHRGDTFQAHAGVHAGLGQRLQLAVVLAVVLHEHQVPDLDVAVQVAVLGARRAAGHVGAVVVEDLGAGTAGAGVAHLPEVVFIQTREALGADAHFLEPDVRRFVVGHMHRHPQLLRRQPQLTGEELPGEADGVALEVIAEAEVAQHFEEGVVAGGVAHVFQVVVLAAGTHAALRAGGAGVIALVAAEEHILELVHPRIGEQQGGIVLRHQRGRRHHGVALAGEVIEKGLANLSALHTQATTLDREMGSKV